MTLNFNIPTSWNELSERQRSKISTLIFNAKENDKGVYFSVLYYLFCPNRWSISKGWKERYKFIRLLLQVPFSELLQYIEFVFVDLKLTNFPKYVIIDKVKYYGPANRLSNVSIEELNFAYRFYFDWITTKDVGALDRLVTTIYRPAKKKKRGDIREIFNEENIMRRGSVFPKLSLDKKIAIGFAFKGSVEYMFSKYPVLFPPQKEKKNKDKSKPKYQSLVPMINAMFMYENQPLGTRNEVIKTNAYVFFDVAQETVVSNKKREAEFNRRK